MCVNYYHGDVNCSSYNFICISCFKIIQEIHLLANVMLKVQLYIYELIIYIILVKVKTLLCRLETRNKIHAENKSQVAWAWAKVFSQPNQNNPELIMFYAILPSLACHSRFPFSHLLFLPWFYSLGLKSVGKSMLRGCDINGPQNDKQTPGVISLAMYVVLCLGQPSIPLNH